MTPVLILQHQTAESAGYLVEWLVQNRVAYETFNTELGARYPDSIEPYSALAILGGGMSANDDILNLRQAEILTLQAMINHKPVIGHCLGGQLMSRALGVCVRQADHPEIGWQHIEYKKSDLTQQWFGSDPAPVVAQWHYDTFDLPTGAQLLASSAACKNQAWCWGPHLAMQFHIEMDMYKAKTWAQDPDPKWTWACENFTSAQSSEQIMAGIDQYLSQHQRMAAHIYRHWLSTTKWATFLQTPTGR
jgi:GMP synthase (glutamine-hydrolysing)